MNQDLLTAAQQARARAHELQLRAARAVQTASVSMSMTSRTVDAVPELDLHKLEREIQGLRTALESRAVIEQAKGIIMGAMNCDAKRAFEVLVRQSQHENRKLHEVAHELVAQRSAGTATRLSRGGSPR